MASAASTGFEYFSTKLFSTVSEQNNGKNIFLSPASIALAMSMCTVGARGETLQQMLSTFEISSIEELTNIGEQVMRVFSIAEEDKEVQLKLANCLYAQKTYELQQEYLNLIQKSFQADIKLEDFENESVKVVQTINTWVEEQTNNLIQNLVSPDDVLPSTQLILINCIYFKGTWVEPFQEYATNKNADFHESNGTKSKVTLMFQEGTYAYAENKDLRIQIAHLPYKSDSRNVQFVFTVILPNQGVDLLDVERKLTLNSQLMKQVLSHKGTTLRDLLLYLPKFKMETTFQLNNVLIQLGMLNAFDPTKADFTGISNARDGLYISKVIHKAFIDVNEKGSEAAAATAVVMCNESCCLSEKQPVIEFKVDRPFLFTIQEYRQGITLFNGKFLSPKN